ncbi:sulfate adenylyltransferase subunit [Trema orientale]|uniref:Sulfate adenylyltransferase subunit n=1 Tax=Trema orientale TaxID=63057 RepID=A0A2P5F0P3_TREOI|nr:sulfate adenylyltransferase subunit [Trema orientale]
MNLALWLQEEARKALEGALGGKKNEFEKWNKEIKRREEAGGGGGGDAGGGGWFGWGGRFGWSNDDNFWQETQQTSLAVLGIIIMYLIVAKGEVMLAVIFNPLLYALRGTRNGFAFITSRILRRTSPDSFNDSDIRSNEAYSRVSAKERVSSKWGKE